MESDLIRVGGDLGLLKGWAGGISKQITLASLRALDATARMAQKDYRRELPEIFDRPTPFTLNSSFVRPTQKGELRASVELRHFAPKGTPADEYLGPQIEGGARVMKRFERRLSFAGIAPHGFAVPARGARLDAHGNVSRGQLVQILSQLKALGDQNAGPRTAKRSKLRVRHGKKIMPGEYFVARSKQTGAPLGVYRLASKGHVEPVLIFLQSAPAYRPRLRYFKIIGDSAGRNFGRFFDEHLTKVMHAEK